MKIAQTSFALLALSASLASPALAHHDGTLHATGSSSDFAILAAIASLVLLGGAITYFRKRA